MKKYGKFLSAVFVSLMFLFPVIVNAEGEVVSINGQTMYNTLEEALAVAQNGDSIKLIENLEIAADTTIPAGITLENTTNTLTVNTGVTLTIAGKLYSSANSKVNVNGTLDVVNGGVVDVKTTYDINGTLHMEGTSTVNVEGILNLVVNSKVVTNAVEGPVINIYQTGSIIGSASALSTAHKVVFNNYGGRMGDTLTATIADGLYNYYPIHDETNNVWYKTFDEIQAGVTAKVIAPHTVNGDTTIAEGVYIIGKSGIATTVNGTFTINGTYEMENGYTSIIAYNLYGTGSVIMNQATEMANGWWTFVTILKDVSTTLTFEAISGYNPQKEDILFELGSNTDEAIAIAAKIKLGTTFGENVAVTPKQTNLNYVNGGTLLGVIGDKIVEDALDTTPPDTGNGDLFVLGLISILAMVSAVYCARRIYILNRI